MNHIEDKHFAVLRIIFGAVWLIDAVFKWAPSFMNDFTGYLMAGANGQPAIVQAWIGMWVKGVSVDPHVFAIFVAVSETAIALGLLFGVLTEIAIAGGIAMTLVIWSTAQGFAGPYVPGSTDIGAALIYAMLLTALWLGKSWRYYSVDRFLKPIIPSLYRHW